MRKKNSSIFRSPRTFRNSPKNYFECILYPSESRKKIKFCYFCIFVRGIFFNAKRITLFRMSLFFRSFLLFFARLSEKRGFLDICAEKFFIFFPSAANFSLFFSFVLFVVCKRIAKVLTKNGKKKIVHGSLCAREENSK